MMSFESTRMGPSRSFGGVLSFDRMGDLLLIEKTSGFREDECCSGLAVYLPISVISFAIVAPSCYTYLGVCSISANKHVADIIMTVRKANLHSFFAVFLGDDFVVIETLSMLYTFTSFDRFQQ